MAIERVVAEILSRHREISRDELLERLQREKRRTGGFISDEILMRAIAAEFGVEIPYDKALAPLPSIKDLVPGLNDVAVIGRVVAVFRPKAFKRNRSGKFASLLVADQSGLLRVVLWNDKTGLVELGEIKVGQVTRFSHGYTREDRGEGVELHIGEKGEVEANPEGVRVDDYPTVNRYATKIGEITGAYKNKRVSVVGMVKELSLASTFQRQDSSSGRVMRLVMADETGEVPVVVWNDKVGECEKTLKRGVGLRIVNGKVKKAVSDAMEVHVDEATYVEVLSPVEEFLKISALKEGLDRVNVEGEVVAAPMFRDVKTSKGEQLRLAVFELKDETGRIWVSAWRKQADAVASLKLHDKVILKDVYVKKGFGDQPELSTRSTTSIVKSGRKE